MRMVLSDEIEIDPALIYYAAILVSGHWIRVSDFPNVRYFGKHDGAKRYYLIVPDCAIIARFRRANNEKEIVIASNGMKWHSFAEANQWAAEYSPNSAFLDCGD